jgi:hypothetical protein
MSASRPRPAGIRIRAATAAENAAARLAFDAWLGELGFAKHVRVCDEDDAGKPSVSFRLEAQCAGAWAPDFDTTQLYLRLGLDSRHDAADLEREILAAMLLSPLAFEFPSFAELEASVRMRLNIVAAARGTQLAFHTTAAERPVDCWSYADDRGFVLLPGKRLVEALQKATQPDASGKLYSFSCYRATEYVVLLGMAQELAMSNPSLLDRLQSQWERSPIMSGRFHDTFLYEYGSLNEPLPLRYYVPGDRLWFRNPDEPSSDVSGYEGSWVFYLGGGLFSNFWKRDRPYTLASKCVEIFHWRDGVYRDAAGEPQMDESVVEERVHATLANPAKAGRILAAMLRLRDPKGVYGGGCIDASREFPRRVCPGTADLPLPAH